MNELNRYDNNPENSKTKKKSLGGKATASLVLGIISICCSALKYTNIIGIGTAIAGIILGIQAKKQYPGTISEVSYILSTVSLIINLISFILSVLLFIACLKISEWFNVGIFLCY